MSAESHFAKKKFGGKRNDFGFQATVLSRRKHEQEQ